MVSKMKYFYLILVEIASFLILSGIILFVILFVGCASVQVCTTWEATPSGVDCIVLAPHPLGTQERDVCMGRTVCRRCIETQLGMFENPFSKPWNACEKPTD
jgi:hypothetical protein